MANASPFAAAHNAGTIRVKLPEDNIVRLDASNSAAQGKSTNKSNAERPQPVQVQDELSVEDRARTFRAISPEYSDGTLILAPEVEEQLNSGISFLTLRDLVFKQWGLEEIEPHPGCALLFHGPSGCGKSRAAHRVAKEMGKKILIITHAMLQSKFQGEALRNLEAIFLAGKQQDCVLFFDEASSALMTRLTNVSQASEHSINSMIEQMLVCLDRYEGLVIFATNLFRNCDPAILRRTRNVYFAPPNAPAREAIWKRHLVKRLPLEDDPRFTDLAAIEATGADIKEAVIEAAYSVARAQRKGVRHEDLHAAIQRIVRSRNDAVIDRSLDLKDLKE